VSFALSGTEDPKCSGGGASKKTAARGEKNGEKGELLSGKKTTKGAAKQSPTSHAPFFPTHKKLAKKRGPRARFGKVMGLKGEPVRPSPRLCAKMLCSVHKRTIAESIRTPCVGEKSTNRKRKRRKWDCRTTLSGERPRGITTGGKRHGPAGGRKSKVELLISLRLSRKKGPPKRQVRLSTPRVVQMLEDDRVEGRAG